MGGTSQNNQIGEGLPKTTTWGRRLALLALITLLPAGLSFAGGKKHKLSKDLEALKGGHNGATVDYPPLAISTGGIRRIRPTAHALSIARISFLPQRILQTYMATERTLPESLRVKGGFPPGSTLPIHSKGSHPIQTLLTCVCWI